ncbi:hypothetical protein DM01DRAFT_1333608 [Hesseltinella vesiculosa]|uniref:Uncharacterized protein n=1 Tax=Hesseltinella vesiculosa TaxID=101127 RepID=A0A1X2GQR8_9FUNG|nr:hypothetical protein DM01DRAFT_1333608 [Hesseltinella vesiculosa]
MATIQANTSTRSAAYHFKKQKHLPYFLEYMLWVFFGSEGLHLMWLKSEYNDYKEHAERKIALLKQVLQLMEAGQPVPESLHKDLRMVMIDEKHNAYYDDQVDEYLEQWIAAIDTKENEPKAVAPPPSSASNASTPAPTTEASNPPPPSPGTPSSDKPKFMI